MMPPRQITRRQLCPADGNVQIGAMLDQKGDNCLQAQASGQMRCRFAPRVFLIDFA